MDRASVKLGDFGLATKKTKKQQHQDEDTNSTATRAGAASAGAASFAATAAANTAEDSGGEEKKQGPLPRTRSNSAPYSPQIRPRACSGMYASTTSPRLL